MTKLGYSNPFRRMAPFLRGLVQPQGSAAAGGAAHTRAHIVGHRGAARECPENTIIAFRRALELGADAIEADLCVTRDGSFVIWHDTDPNTKIALARQLGAECLFVIPEGPPVGSTWRRPVRELTLEEMRPHYRYRLCSTANAGGRTEVSEPFWPFDTLEDLFRMAESGEPLHHVYLDIKLEESQTDAARDLVRAIHDRFGLDCKRTGPTFHLLTPQLEIFTALLAELPPIEKARILPYADFELPGAAAFARRLGARNVSMGAGGRLWRGFLQEIEDVLAEMREGRVDRVTAWTLNDARQLAELTARGVDAILTDDVPLLLRLQSDDAETQVPSPSTPCAK